MSDSKVPPFKHSTVCLLECNSVDPTKTSSSLENRQHSESTDKGFQIAAVEVMEG